MNQNRLKFVTFTIILFYFVILGRLFYWQIIQYENLGQKLINQNYKASVIPPQKGEIYDSQNNPLVINQPLFKLSIYKPDLKLSPDQLSAIIKQINPDEEATLNKFLINQNQKWITIKSLLSNEQKKNINDPGISFAQITKRFYPENDLAKDILNENTGLENYYKKQLSGKPGFVWESKDATGQTILSKTSMSIEPVNGRNLHTTFNRQVQYIIEKKLKEGITKFAADSGSITVISPQSGAVLAMASFTATGSATVNPVIANLFEPGSIFKPLVVSMALDTNSINTNFICTKCDRPHQIGQYSISNWDSKFTPNSSLQDIIKNSDNIGMSYIIANLGLNNFIQYFQKLNLDRKIGIDLQGEAKPINKINWPEIDLATASFGQGFAVTQIQMVAAFNSIANNGTYVHPYIVDHFSEDDKIFPNSRRTELSIFKKETVSDIKSILKYSVENGVVAKFKPPKLDVCAKSGTSQIAIKGGYSDSSTIASYIGFSPCQNPKFTMIVTINNPKSSPWGSSTAAPIWYEIASSLDSLL